MKKLDYLNVKQEFELHGCVLLEDNYSNNVTPMKFKCKCGKVCSTTYANFRSGSRCKSCGIKKASDKKKMDTGVVSDLFISQNCELLGDYKNNYTPVKYRCSCGNISKIRLFALLKGQRCRKCSTNKGEKHYKWNPNREEIALNKTLQRRCRQMLLYSLSKIGQKKKQRKSYLLGYAPIELRKHIESFPEWNNLKNKNWHLDHIFPVIAFVKNKVTDIKLINSFDNIRPVLAEVNLKKNDKYDKNKFKFWLANRGILLETIS